MPTYILFLSQLHVLDLPLVFLEQLDEGIFVCFFPLEPTQDCIAERSPTPKVDSFKLFYLKEYSLSDWVM